MVTRYGAERVKEGQSATVTVGNRVYAGTVTKICGIAEYDASGKAKVKVDVLLEETSGMPTIGLDADVVITSALEDDAVGTGVR